MASANDRLKVALEEKAHDADMARANVAQLTQMLEERSQDNESVQRERVQSIAGEQFFKAFHSLKNQDKAVLCVQRYQFLLSFDR